MRTDASEVLANALREDDATRWAGRIIQIFRVWQMAQTLPAMPENPATVTATA